MSRKSTIGRLAGFVGALGVSAALVAVATQSTGAYFTDSVDGGMTGTSGVLQVTTRGATQLDFTGLMPGQDQSKQIEFAATSSSSVNEDVWLVFDTDTQKYGKFTGASGVDYNGYTDGGLGRYGHFKVDGLGNNDFQSYNLAFAPEGQTGCSVNGNGNGGSGEQGTEANDYTPNWCGVPGAIKIAGNIAPGDWHSATITFGLTARAQDPQGAQWVNVPFDIVATQVGIHPDANSVFQ